MKVQKEEIMVSAESVEAQLVNLKFNFNSWGRTEARELHNILLPEEEIFECVNGIYEGGFALLVATNIRVLLVDKKPLNFLTVEDLRFDMINELDYSHRLFGAQISISAGSKNLRFRSYNQGRLRKLIHHVQNTIAEIKRRQSQHQEGQNSHLEQLNQQLEAYLWAQFKSQQEQMATSLKNARNESLALPVNPELAEFIVAPPAINLPQPVIGYQKTDTSQQQQLYEEGMKEVFGKRQTTIAPVTQPPANSSALGIEVNDFKVAYSKLPMVLRNRKFSRHAGFVRNVSPAVSVTQP